MSRGRGGGPKPKPTHLKLVEGNPGKRPLNNAEPQPTRGPIPLPPRHLSEPAKEEWLRLSEELHNLRLLTMVDLNPFAAYCQAFGRWVLAENKLAEMAARDPTMGGMVIKTQNGNAIHNPLLGIANKAASDMMRYAAEFGLTPTARARLALGPEPQVSKFDGLIAV